MNATGTKSAAPTIRISRIPATWGEEQLCERLECLYKEDPHGGEAVGAARNSVKIRSLAHDPSEPNYKMATSEINPLPGPLNALGTAACYGINVKVVDDVGDEHELHFDTGFIGLTTLHTLESPAVDIIAVNGLGGHALGSWKSPSGSKVWLRDFLPKHVPTARIMTYGYNTALLHSRSKSFIQDLSKVLLELIRGARSQPNERRRPIIFVGHSLGGLVIKDVVATAGMSDDSGGQGMAENTELLRACYAFLFFGVPNRGLNHASLFTLVEGCPNDRLVYDLIMDRDKESSPLIRALDSSFKNCFTLIQDSPILSFYEKHRSPTVSINPENMKATLDGPEVLMVPEHSATHSGPNQKLCNNIPVESNHRNLVKFSGELDPTYQIVRSRLSGMVLEAVSVVKRRYEVKLAPREGIFEVPFPRSPEFADRGDLLHRLEELLPLRQDGVQRRAALTGLGGIGKSTIAVEYCYRQHKSTNHQCSVFWVHGDSNESFGASYGRIAEAAEITIPEASDNNALLRSVRMWLDRSDSGIWLMVVDNLDNIRLNFEHLPRLRGVILFTSRDGRLHGDADWGVSVYASVEILQMSTSEAFLMCAKMGLEEASQDDNASAPEYAALGELLDLLGYLPLAIAQAAAYIRQTGRRGIRISEYVELFKESADIQERLLAKPQKSGLPGSERDTQVIMKTWRITIDKIKTENPVAVDMLQFMSALNPDDIPLELVRAYRPFSEHDRLVMAESVGMLISFSLISELKLDHSDSYRLHRLVSFSTRRQMNSDLDEVAAAVLASIPDDQKGDLLKCARMLPHAVAVEDQMQDNVLSDARCNVQHTVASIMDDQGEYNKALEWYQRALESKEKALGKNHRSTLDTVYNLAGLYRQRDHEGDLLNAADGYQRAFDGYTKVFGSSHSETCDASHQLNRVRSLLKDRGKLALFLS